MTEFAAARWTRLAGGLALLAVVALLGVAFGQHWSPLLDLDRWFGRDPFDVTAAHSWLADTLKVVATITEPDTVVVVGVVAAIALALRKHRRLAGWLVVVLLVTRGASLLVKDVVDRPRPVWEHPIVRLTSPSFPSSHAAESAAAAAVAVVAVLMLVRRRALRRVLVSLAVLLALLVGLDRIFLGVHNLSDVVAGWALGAGVALLGLGLFDPTPRPLATQLEPLPEAIPQGEKLLAVVLNPIKVDDAEGFRSMVETLGRASGFTQFRWWETTVEDTGYRMAHEAAVSSAALVMAVGGDGTIRAVCEELAGTGIPVGIVPAGTGNLLARNLEIPLYLRAAVDQALNGQDRAIDMVEVSGDNTDDAVFLVMAGMGFDAAIMEGVNEDFKAKVGWLAYVWSALKSLLFPAITVEVSVDGGEFTRHKARTVVIGNVGYLQAGMPLLPDASIDDGRIDLVLLYPRRFLSWLPLAARVLTKNKRTDETITRMSGESIVVRTGSDAPRQIDGDLIAPGRELHARCVHGRLLVRVPR